jgi:2-hydroxy-6-oxonona-2,4-dienedioate hydrolase
MQRSVGGNALQACYHDLSFVSFRYFFVVILFNGKAVPDEVLRRRAESTSKPHLDAWKASTGFAQRSLVNDLPNVKHQALIIHGRNDRVVTPEAGVQLLALLPNSQLHMFNRCGHWVQYEHADEFNRMVVDFIDHDQPEA